MASKGGRQRSSWPTAAIAATLNSTASIARAAIAEYAPTTLLLVVALLLLVVLVLARGGKPSAAAGEESVAAEEENEEGESKPPATNRRVSPMTPSARALAKQPLWSTPAIKMGEAFSSDGSPLRDLLPSLLLLRGRFASRRQP